MGARAIADLDAWFEQQWAASRDFKDELIGLLDASKFGAREYTPYQVYMKALYEYYRDDLDQETAPTVTRSAVEMAEFQEDAVKKARKILERYDGVLVGDSVGLGKTCIGKKLLEDHAYHQRLLALVVCPASLRPMWEKEVQRHPGPVPPDQPADPQRPGLLRRDRHRRPAALFCQRPPRRAQRPDRRGAVQLARRGGGAADAAVHQACLSVRHYQRGILGVSVPPWF